MTNARDVPAAHSMDTNWFCVDAYGNLALFDTDEPGAVPIGAAGDNSSTEPEFAAIAAAVGATDVHLYGEDRFYERDYPWDARWAEWSGPLFHYTHADDITGRYIRRYVPTRPARIEEVPEHLRRFIPRLPVRFARTPVVQPLEHVACETYSAIWLSSDGKTVRPVPGREAEAERQWDHAREKFTGAVFVHAPQPYPPNDEDGG